MKILELFSGTHSIGKVALERGWEVVSLDRDLPSDIKEDIMTWDYKSKYRTNEFDIITASPVCLWWSNLRTSYIGRKLKCHNGQTFTRELLNKDIDTYGKPMVDKVREIIDYFKPKYYWIENPQNGSMKNYITDLPYYDVDYCQYSDWGYKKRTRFWTNIKGFEPKKCDGINCSNIIEETRNKKQVKHINTIGMKNDRTSLHDRYRIPSKLIYDLFDKCI